MAKYKLVVKAPDGSLKEIIVEADSYNGAYASQGRYRFKEGGKTKALYSDVVGFEIIDE